MALSQLSAVFFAPLLISPLLAVALVIPLYLTLRTTRLALNVNKESCLCVGEQIVGTTPIPAVGEAVFKSLPLWKSYLGSTETYREHYRGRFLGIPIARVLNALHYFSAGAVSFARGLNDTPKIAAVLISEQVLPSQSSYAMVGLLIAVGSWISARLVAETMSLRITSMNPGQRFSANLVATSLVIGASPIGLPVSTTHVSAGSIFGIGLLTGELDRRVMTKILLSWVAILPLAAILSAIASYSLLAT